MNGKQHFIDCCDKLGLDYNALFQLGENNAAAKDRLKHSFSPHTRKETQLFAVCYFVREGLFLAWSLKEPKAKKKEVFSMKRFDIKRPLNGTISAVEKAIEYHGWAEENVLVFEPDAVELFLKKYCEVQL